MFGDFNLEDFSIFTKYKSYSKSSLLINYGKLFNPLYFGQMKHLPAVENPGQSVNKDRFLRSKVIVVYCYS